MELEQQLDHRGIGSGGSENEGRDVVLVHRVHVRVLLEELASHIHTMLAHSPMKGRAYLGILPRTDVSSVAEKEVDDLYIALAAGNLDRRTTVVDRIDLSALGNQELDRLQLVAHARVSERRVSILIHVLELVVTLPHRFVRTPELRRESTRKCR